MMSPTYTLETETEHSTAKAEKREMAVYKIDPLQDPRWKAFVAWHPDSSLFHRIEWLQALKSCYGYTPAALTSSAPGSALEDGLVYCEIKSSLTGKRLVSVPFSDHCQPLVSHPDVLDSFLQDLVLTVDQQHWKYFEIRPITYAETGTQQLGISNTYHLHRLDLSPSEEVLFKRFDKDSVQRKIRRAERESLRYEEGSSAAATRLLLQTDATHAAPSWTASTALELVSQSDRYFRRGLEDQGGV